MVQKILDNDNEPFEFWLELYGYGWIDLLFSFDNQECRILMSDVYDPIKEFVLWIDKLAIYQPAMLEIDEEGRNAILAIEPLSNNLVRFSAQDKDSQKVYFDKIFDRNCLATAFKNEFINFFSNTFDPRHWDKSGFDEEDEEFYQDGLKEWILNHQWK